MVSPRTTMGLPWSRHGPTMVYHGLPIATSWTQQSLTMQSPWSRHGIIMVSPCSHDDLTTDHHGLTLGLPWTHHGSTMGIHRLTVVSQ